MNTHTHYKFQNSAKKSEIGSFQITVVIVALVIIAGLVYWYWQKSRQPVTIQPSYNIASTTAADIPKIETPALDTTKITEAAPLAGEATEKIPELNPIEKTNPFKGLYVNPFGR